MKHVSLYLWLIPFLYSCNPAGPEYDEKRVEKTVPWESISGKIAYTIDLSDNHQNLQGIYVIDASAQRINFLYTIDEGDYDRLTGMVLSPAGDSLAFSLSHELYIIPVVDTAGIGYGGWKKFKSENYLSNLSWQSAGVVSSLGINYEGGRSVLCFNGTELVGFRGYCTSRAGWTQDGKKAVICLRDSVSFGSLYLFSLTESAFAPLLQPKQIDSIVYGDPVLSPDGKTIAFIEKKPVWRDELYNNWISSLWVMNIDRTGLRKVKENCFSPSWSPDGSKILYSSNGEIRLINQDGTNDIKICNGGNPTWSR